MSRCSSAPRDLLLVCLYLIVLLTPSAHYQIFSGIPLSNAPQYLFGVALAPLLVHRGLRRLFARFVAAKNGRLAHGLCVAAVTALALKAGLAWSGDYRGLLGC
jgi:predicted membrane chloride channel (bestrophin family)